MTTTTTSNVDHHDGDDGGTNKVVSSDDRSSSSSINHLKLSFKNSKFTKHVSTSRKRTWKNLKQILALESTSNLPVSMATYKNIEAPPSLYPKKKYCDLTGYVAPYTDPKTGLRYCDSDVYQVLDSFSNDIVQRYLALRKAHVVLK